MTTKRGSWLIYLVFAGLISACGGLSDDGTTGAEPPTTGGPTPQPSAEPSATPEPSPTPTPATTPAPGATPTPIATPLPASLAEIQASVFDASCASCHVAGGIAASTGLFLDTEHNSFALLVNQASSGKPGETRVVPNQPDLSYLIKKLEGAADIAGSQMPLGSAPLDAALITRVRSWIAAGALADSPPPTPTPQPSATPVSTPTPQPTATPLPTATPAPASLAQVQANVFDPHCASCHVEGGFADATGLYLNTTAISYARLVNQASTGSPGEVRVIPNDPDASYLIKKLEGASGIAGSQMPLGNDALSPELIAQVRGWIAAGAPADPTAPPAPTPVPTATPAPTPTPQPTATPGPTPTPAPASLAQIQANVFDAHCASCHVEGGFADATGLYLNTTAISFARLVNQASTGSPGEVRVIPNDPEASYLIKKLEGASGIAGSQMPLGGDALSPELIAQVRGWIAAGAPADPTAPPPTPTPVPTATPQPTVTPVPTGASLQRVQDEIFSVTCSGCHNPNGPASSTGLFLSSASVSFDNLVNVASSGASGQTRVIPNDPDNSYLVRKLEGGPNITGQRMPRGLPALSNDQIALVRQWIADGALAAPVNPNPTPTPGPTMARVQNEIFTPICSGCHLPGGDAKNTGLYLRNSEESHRLLVNVQSFKADGEIRVIPNNASASYLIKKLEDDPDIDGKRMPRDQPPLSIEQIALVRDWINDGAPADPAAGGAALLNNSLTIVGDSVELALHFNAPIDETSIAPSAAQVYLHKGVERRNVVLDSLRLDDDGHTLRMQVAKDKISDADMLEIMIDDESYGGLMSRDGRLVDGDADGEDGGAINAQFPLPN